MTLLRRLRLLIVPASALLAIPSFAGGSTASSNPCAVYGMPSASLHWKTAMSDTLPIVLDWPVSAVSATLTVSADGKTVDTIALADRTKDVYSYSVTLPVTTDDERVLNLMLTFANANAAVIEERTASVGLVRGTGDTTASVVACGEVSPKWAKRKTKAKGLVLPVPEGATELTIGQSPSVPLDAPGWFWWSVTESGVYNLTMQVGDEQWTADPWVVLSGGFLLLLR